MSASTSLDFCYNMLLFSMNKVRLCIALFLTFFYGFWFSLIWSRNITMFNKSFIKKKTLKWFTKFIYIKYDFYKNKIKNNLAQIQFLYRKK